MGGFDKNEGSRRLEDLNHDILKEIFKHVSSKTNSNFCSYFIVFHVCRSWQLACLDILFWSRLKTLDFRDFMSSTQIRTSLPSFNYFIEKDDLIRSQWRRLVRGIFMDRIDANGFPLEQWRQSITKIVIPASLGLLLHDQDLLFLAQRTPGVETLILSESSHISIPGFAKAMSYWKNVKHISVTRIVPYVAENIGFIEQMGKSRPQLATLELSTSLHLLTNTAHVLVKSFPKLTTLRLRKLKVSKAAIRFIIANTPELKIIHFSSCALSFMEFYCVDGPCTYTFDWRSKETKSGDSEWFFHYMTDSFSGFKFPYDNRLYSNYDRWIS